MRENIINCSKKKKNALTRRDKWVLRMQNIPVICRKYQVKTFSINLIKEHSVLSLVLILISLFTLLYFNPRML